MNAPSSHSSTWKPLLAVMGAVTLWCVYQAIGTYLSGNDVRKPLIVMAVWLAFIGGWVLMLYSRGRRIARNRQKDWPSSSD